jgi:hypothetical protein
MQISQSAHRNGTSRFIIVQLKGIQVRKGNSLAEKYRMIQVGTNAIGNQKQLGICFIISRLENGQIRKGNGLAQST